MKGFDFEEERLKREIISSQAKRVLIQMPEGLKPEGPRIAKIVEKLGVTPIISADACYGACDLATIEAEALGADLIIHFGHAKLLKHEKVPTIYIESRSTLPIETAVLSSIPLLKDYSRIGLATTVQHVQRLGLVREILSKSGKTIAVGDARRLPYAGQVVGCDYSNAKAVADDVDAFLFVGGGKFHALGVELTASKPTIIADPYSGVAYSISEEVQKILKQRFWRIQEATRAKNIGILVSLKPGQKHLDEALRVKETVEKMDKSSYIFAVREIQPEILAEFPSVDAYVNTACPRISLDDATKFKKPVLTIQEFSVVSGEYTWEKLIKQGLFEK